MPRLRGFERFFCQRKVELYMEYTEGARPLGRFRSERGFILSSGQNKKT